MLGVSEAEFWRMGPRQFRERLDAHNDREERMQVRDDYRAGVIAAALYNTRAFRAEGSRDMHPHDFFASLDPPVVVPQSPSMIRTLFREYSGAKVVKA